MPSSFTSPCSLRGVFAFCPLPAALSLPALGDVPIVPADGDTPLLEDLAQVSAVEGFVEEVLEHHAAVQAVVGIGGAATSFSFRTLCSSKILRTHSSASVIAKLARFLKVLLPEEKQISFSPILYFTQYSSEYYIYQLRRILI